MKTTPRRLLSVVGPALGLVAILALAAGPAFARPLFDGSTVRHAISGHAAAAVSVDEDADEAPGVDEDPGDQGADEDEGDQGADEDNDDQGADENDDNDAESSDESDSGGSGGGESDDGGSGGDHEGSGGDD